MFTRLNVFLTASVLIILSIFLSEAKADAPITLWVGGVHDGATWHDTIYAKPGQEFNVDVWYQGESDVWVAATQIILGANLTYISGFDSAACICYYPLTAWDIKDFCCLNDESGQPFPMPPGRISFSFLGFADVNQYPNPFLHYVTPTKILTFTANAIDNLNLVDSTCCDVFMEGVHHIAGGNFFGDTLGEAYGFEDYYACVRFIHPNPGTIEGTVTAYLGDSLANIQVEILGTAKADTTDMNGYYCFTGVIPGIYSISFFHPDWCDSTVSNTVVTEGDTTELSLEMNNGGAIAGSVTDPNAFFLAGVIVKAGGKSDITDIFGEYIISNLCQGAYSVSFEFPDYCDTTKNGVSVTANDTTDIDMIMNKGGAVKGFVYDNNFDPIPGLVVSAGREDELSEDVTELNGEYFLNLQCPGAVTIKVEHLNGLIIAAIDTTVGASDTISVNFFVCPPVANPEEVRVWFGGRFPDCDWRDTVYTMPNMNTKVEVWLEGGGDVWIADIALMLGANVEYFSEIVQSECEYYYPFT